MNSLVIKILYKLYMQEICLSLINKLKLNRQERKIQSFVKIIDSLSTYQSEEIEFLANKYFNKPIYRLHLKLIDLIIKNYNHELTDDFWFYFFENEKYFKLKPFILIVDTFGRFDIGLKLHKLYFKKIENNLENLPNRRTIVDYYYYVSIFGGDLFRAKLLLNKIKVPFYLKSIHNMIINENLDKNLNSYFKVSEYSKHIYNKDIAILSPGLLDFNKDLTKRLVKIDEIITINYSSLHFNKLPLRISISYLNYSSSYEHFYDKSLNLSKEIKLWCLKVPPKSKIFNYVEKSRSIYRDGHKWTIGGPHMIQCIIYDLIQFSPNKIEIYGMNLFLSKKIHHDNYPGRGSISNLQFASHNIISNFLYVENLFKEKIINLDSTSQAIVNSGLENYAKEMTKLYSMRIRY